MEKYSKYVALVLYSDTFCGIISIYWQVLQYVRLKVEWNSCAKLTKMAISHIPASGFGTNRDYVKLRVK